MKAGKVFASLALAFLLAGCATCPARNGMSDGPRPVKNVIFLLTDGTGPVATAYATGHKGSDKGISVAPWHITIAAADGDPALEYIPLATILEEARLSGRATGLVAISNIQHATPAAFSSHWHDRSNYNEIGEQQVYQNIDVVLGGGKQYLLPRELSGSD